MLFARGGRSRRVVEEEAADGRLADGFGIDFAGVDLAEKLLGPGLAAGDERLGHVADLIGQVVVEVDDRAADGWDRCRTAARRGRRF